MEVEMEVKMEVRALQLSLVGLGACFNGRNAPQPQSIFCRLPLREDQKTIFETSPQADGIARTV